MARMAPRPRWEGDSVAANGGRVMGKNRENLARAKKAYRRVAVLALVARHTIVWSSP